MVQLAGTETWGDDTTKQKPQAAETDLLITVPLVAFLWLLHFWLQCQAKWVGHTIACIILESHCCYIIFLWKKYFLGFICNKSVRHHLDKITICLFSTNPTPSTEGERKVGSLKCEDHGSETREYLLRPKYTLSHLSYLSWTTFSPHPLSAGFLASLNLLFKCKKCERL